MHYLNLQNVSSKVKNNKILVNDFNLLHTKQKFNGQLAQYKKNHKEDKRPENKERKGK